MPQGRRLTLAPAASRAIRSECTAVTDDGEGVADGVEDWSCRKGREALSRAVALAADACRRPKPVHGQWVGVDSPSLAFPSRFWAQGADDDSDDEALVEMKSPSTLEFIEEALDAGFTVDQLARAEKALAQGTIQGNSLATTVGKVAAA